MSNWLSKSRYCNAVQCPKMVWLKDHRPEEFDESVLNQDILNTGLEVGDLAMGLFGDYVEVPYGNLNKMVDKTEELLNVNTPIIAEASFRNGSLFCSVDILKNHGNKEVEIYEVKSSTEIKDINYDDVSFQYYILAKLGFNIKSCNLVYINNQYVRTGDIDLNQLFIIQDITPEVINRQEKTSDNIKCFQKYLLKVKEPQQDITENCFKPYMCGFFKYCSKHLPHPNVFDIAGLKLPDKLKYYNENIISFNDLLNVTNLSDKYHQQVEYELLDKNSYIDKINIKQFMKSLSYPLYFLDFESFAPAIPLYDNSRPYEQIVFQYSLHYIEKEGDKLQHNQFLAYPNNDPRKALAEQLCKDIPLDVCTVAYNMSFEKRQIKALANLYPELKEHLMNIHDHIVDLMIPFQNRWFYNKAMQGSNSIKYVLPALFPDDPSLNYHNLEGVHNGEEASNTFKKMATMTKEELDISRNQLLKYCELDTYAMVKVWEVLKEI